jgi:hypothetical protein
MSVPIPGLNPEGELLPGRQAEGPGFLGPDYNPADEMLAPAKVGVRRGDGLGDVMQAVKGVIYYTDMIGFGEASSAFTRGMPGLRPLGVNYFLRTGAKCDNGAEMWEYISLIPDGSALGERVKVAIKDMGLPQLRGLAPGVIEDAKSALNPSPVINAVMGSGYPKCKLVRMPVGDFDGKVTNVDGKLIVDPEGLILGSDKRYYQEKWVQQTDRKGVPIQIPYDEWEKAPKLYRDNGCLLNPKGRLPQPSTCGKGGQLQKQQLGDGSVINVLIEGFCGGGPQVPRDAPNENHVKLAVSVVGLLGLFALWNLKK